DADAVDAANPHAVRDRMGSQLELPEGASGCRGRRHEHQVAAAQRERPRALWEVAVVADDRADRDAGFGGPDGVAEVAGPEVVLLDPGDRGNLHQRNAVLAVLADDLLVRIDAE